MLQFDTGHWQLCELPAKEFGDAGFADEVSFYGLPASASVQGHFNAAAVLLMKVRATSADLTRGITTQCPRLAWRYRRRYFPCSNHFSAIEQLKHSRVADTCNNSMVNYFVPIKSWNEPEQIMVPMADLSQQVPCNNKDSKALCNICTHIQPPASDLNCQFCLN